MHRAYVALILLAILFFMAWYEISVLSLVFSWYTDLYYPTAANTVQISREMSTNIQRYCTVICTVAKLFAGQVGARTQNCQILPLSLINSLTNSSWIINLLVDVLVCSIAVYLYSLFIFGLALRARQNTAQLVKIYSDTTHQNI